MNGSTATRPEHPNADEAEENNLKNNFMKMIEALKEEMKNSLIKVEEKANKKWKKSINSLKKTKKNQSNG